MVFNKLYIKCLKWYNYLYQRCIHYHLKNIGAEIHKTVYLGKRTSITLTSEFWYSSKGRFIALENVKIGSGFNCECYGGLISIGERTTIGQNATFYGHGGIEIGNDTLIAMDCIIVSSNHNVPKKEVLIGSSGDKLMPVKIGSDVWIGGRVTILGGVTIGNGCVIGAGSVVTKSLPPNSVAVGIPAKILKYRD